MFFLSIVLYTKLIEIGLKEFNFLSFSYTYCVLLFKLSKYFFGVVANFFLKAAIK